MPRIARMIFPDQPTVYHVMSRTALDGYPFGDIEKDELVRIIRHLNKVYFTDIIGFCIMGNHFHILIRMLPASDFPLEEIKDRFIRYYGNDLNFDPANEGVHSEKWASLSEFMRDLKQRFSRYYNKRHNRRGTLWGERFKSLIVENGETLINCLAYIDLNPLRAGLVERPEDYRWNSIAYHLQAANKDSFLSLDFGLKEFGDFSDDERLTAYRRFLYETGAVDRSAQGSRKVIEEKYVEKLRKQDFKISRTERFRYRTRYFSDSGIIGSKVFVAGLYQRFKAHFQCKHDKIPNPIKGLGGIYSLKRLAEI